MWFVVAGVVMIVLNLADIGPFALWTWELTGDLWKFLAPFAAAGIWWTWADKSGLNKRREIEKMEERKRNRRRENLVALGMDPRSRRR